MAEKWIQGAIKHPGAFKAKAKAAGKSTAGFARSVLKEGSQASTRTKRQAALAQTLSKLRAGKAKFLVPLVLAALVSSVQAATKTCPSGQLGGTLTTTGPTPDVLIARAAPALAVQATSPAGTATVVVEMSCDGTNWAPVANSSMSLAAATPSQAVSLLQPTCTYRANVTACASCSVTVFFSCSGA
jgi:hypothetical protein